MTLLGLSFGVMVGFSGGIWIMVSSEVRVVLKYGC